MASVTWRVKVTSEGPLFDDRAQKYMDEFITDAVHEAANQGLADWHTHLDTSLQHPTGRYESHLMAELQSSDRAIVHDQGMIYGPWLEGTGSRNSTTKFKGYADARLATQQLEAECDRVLQPSVERLIARLEGR